MKAGGRKRRRKKITRTTNPDCNWFVYIVRSACGKHTYIGKTNDLHRRLRQHNRELTGGAKKTALHGPWHFWTVLSGFPKGPRGDICAMRVEHRLQCPKDNLNKTRTRSIKSKAKHVVEVLGLKRVGTKARVTKNLGLKVTTLETEERFCALAGTSKLPSYVDFDFNKDPRTLMPPKVK
jgi:predicted GIY-YIG superfamily endonuclease